MLQSILNKLKNDSKYNHIFNSKEKMSVVMLSTGYYRAYEKGKIMFLILLGNEPKLLLKFYKLGNNMIRREFNIQKTMYEKCADIISEPIEILHVNNFEIMIEKAYVGKSLERYFYDNPFKNEIQSVMKNLFKVYASMEKIQQLSTHDEFEKEIKIIVDKFIKSYCPNDKELSAINECILILLKHFKNEKIYKRLSNDDFTPRNLIVNNSMIKIIDFEFAEETHLYFLDWFKFFRIQYALPNKYLYEILHADIEDKYCLLALREFSNFYSKDKIVIACRFMIEIKEFVMLHSIHSHIFHNYIKAGFQPLISEISSRLNEQEQSHDVINPYELNGDLSLEKTLFHDRFLKLSDCQNTIAEQDAEIKNYKNTIAEQDAEIKNYKNTIAEQDAEIKNYKNTIAEQDAEIKNYKNTIAEQDAEIKNYKKFIAEIQQSFVFRTLRKYDKTIGKIFPLKLKK